MDWNPRQSREMKRPEFTVVETLVVLTILLAIAFLIARAIKILL